MRRPAMLQPLQQPQEAAHLPPVRDREVGTRPYGTLAGLGAPGGSSGRPRPGFAGEVDRDWTVERGQAGRGRCSRARPHSLKPPPPRLEAVGAHCELDEREWRLAVSLLWPLVPASPRGRPGGMSAPRMAGPHGRDFNCGKVGDSRSCRPGTPFPQQDSR